MLIEVMDKWNRDDIEKIIGIALEFIIETNYPVTFNPDIIYGRLHAAFFDPDSDIVIARLADDIVGAAVVHAMADWQEEKFGYVEKFFVAPRGRRIGVGRAMTAEISKWFDQHDCLFSFATSTAGIGETRLFSNMMAKFGYQSVGPTLARTQHGKV